MIIATVGGYCPACGRQSLFVDNDGIYCWLKDDCPAPDTAGKIFADPEVHHIVKFLGTADDRFIIKHPLRERADDDLFDCTIARTILDMDHPVIGRWRLVGIPEIVVNGTVVQEPDWAWEQIDD